MYRTVPSFLPWTAIGRGRGSSGHQWALAFHKTLSGNSVSTKLSLSQTPTLMKAIFLVSSTVLFALTAYSVKPVEIWKNEYKTCVYDTCPAVCQSDICTDCSNACKSAENGHGYHGTLLCLKDCKESCARLKSQDCGECKLKCRNLNLPKRTDADIEAYRTWKEECKVHEMCGWDCTKDWRSEDCKKCRKVFC